MELIDTNNYTIRCDICGILDPEASSIRDITPG